MKIWKHKRNFAKQKWKFFGGNGNGNRTKFSSKTDAHTKVSLSD
jgi:hypothetical protein